MTANLKDFRPQDTGPHGVEALSADAFLTKLLDEQAVELCSAALANQADFHDWTLKQLLELLGQPGEHRPAWLPQYLLVCAEYLRV